MSVFVVPFEIDKPNFYWRQFDGSDRLFRACWREMRRNYQPSDDINVMEILDSIASELVNNPRSSFYIYGE